MGELIEFKKNIIAWFPIKENSNVLQFGKDEEITKELKSKTSKVTVIENILKVSEKYDYITLIGAFENIEKEKIIELLEFAKEHLTQDGKILIATKNKFGMKYWAGEKINLSANAFDAIVKSEENYLGFNKMKEILNSLNLKYKFYYPLPDYNFTNVIFTDEYLPSKDSIDARDLSFSKEDELIVFSEREAYKQIIEQDKNMFPFFANSYFIEVSNKENFEDVKYVSYGITRQKNYRIKTVMKKSSVYKNANTNEANTHIENIAKNINILNNCNINCLDTFSENTIISKYLENAISYDKVLMNDYYENGLEKVIEKIEEFKINILDKLLADSSKENTIFEKYGIEINENLKEKLHFTKNGIIDLIFQNCLVESEKIYVYDQEWYEENVPIEFILYRAIFYFTELKKLEDVNKIYEKLEIKEFVEIFEKLETKVQAAIVDEKMWKLHIKSTESFEGSSNIIENYKNQILEANKHSKELDNVIEEYQKQIEELNSRIGEKDVQLENYANELRAIANSISWKITKPIRSISGVLHSKK